MRIHTQRHLRIEIIAAPFPAGLADQLRKMIGGKFFHVRHRFEAESQHGVPGGLHGFARREDIDVGLRARFRTRAEPCALREPLQRQKLDACLAQPVGQRAVEFFDPPQTLQVAGRVPVQPFDDPRWQSLAPHHVT